jgi:hypothetical protein
MNLDHHLLLLLVLNHLILFQLKIARNIFHICITIVFALKNTCIIGIILIICKVIILISTSLYDVIEFALLLPAGIIALREKKVNEEVFKI